MKVKQLKLSYSYLGMPLKVVFSWASIVCFQKLFCGCALVHPSHRHPSCHGHGLRWGGIVGQVYTLVWSDFLGKPMHAVIVCMNFYSTQYILMYMYTASQGFGAGVFGSKLNIC